VRARVVFAIAVIGLTAAGVLSLRQARLQAAHELTQARLRAVLLEERIAERRAAVAAATAPDAVRPATREPIESGDAIEPEVAHGGER